MWQLEQQPMTIKQVLNKGYELWLAAFKTEIGLLTLFFILSSASFVILELVIPAYFPDQLRAFAELQFVSLLSIIGAVYFLGFSIIFAAIFSRLKYLNNGQALSIMGALCVGIRKLPVFIVALIIAVVTNLLAYSSWLYQEHYYLAATILLFPGFYLIPVFNLYYALIIVEDLGPLAAYKRAFQLIWNNWWRTALVLVVPFLLSLLFMSFAYIIFTIAQAYFQLTGIIDFIAFIVIQGVCTTFYLSGFVVVSFAQVYNLRARKGEQLPPISQTKLKVVNG